MDYLRTEGKKTGCVILTSKGDPTTLQLLQSERTVKRSTHQYSRT